MNSATECVLFRDYENLTKAGAGGFGLVLKAKKKGDNFFSAIKLIPIDAPTKKDTLSEAERLSAIPKHDSIVSFLDYWEDVFTKNDHDNFLRLIKPKKTEPFYYFPTNSKEFKFLCIRMEFCENGTLKEWLKNRKRCDASENIQILLQLARGIELIHTNKLIHRDVKPANVLFYKKNAKISDFGWSATHNVGEYQHTPHAGAALYQTPEQAYGKYGQSADYYALGLILFELFHPEAQKNVGKTLTALKFVREIPMEIKGKYPIIAELIVKLISVEPKERPNCNTIVRIIKPMLDVTLKPEISIQSSNKCRNCLIDLNLFGVRYKCTICPQYFLCVSCEEDDDDHTKNHNFLKIKTSENTNNGNHGCQHYRRKCKLKCPVPECGPSNGLYFCRLCHDENIKGHKLDRFSVQEIQCTSCGMHQFPRSTCLVCSTSFAKYFCSICNLFDDSEDADKLIYHCFLCGMCRKKGHEAIQYTHCNRCCMCYPKSIVTDDGQEITDDTYFKHECLKEAGKIPCSVCNQSVHESREAAVLADCHHYIHNSCKATFPEGVVNCPLCSYW